MDWAGDKLEAIHCPVHRLPRRILGKVTHTVLGIQDPRKWVQPSSTPQCPAAKPLLAGVIFVKLICLESLGR